MSDEVFIHGIPAEAYRPMTGENWAKLLSTNVGAPAPPMTAESFAAACRGLMAYRAAPTRFFMSSRMMKMVDDWARTATLKEIGNYVLLALDGRTWWARARGINATLPSFGRFPRDTSEGWTPWYTFNRHWRRRGFPTEIQSLDQWPRLQAARNA